tara:strand:- start:246 stop:383 length:138 start_codon:yes stop_codon:yes gene_type:complete
MTSEAYVLSMALKVCPLSVVLLALKATVSLVSPKEKSPYIVINSD